MLKSVSLFLGTLLGIYGLFKGIKYEIQEVVKDQFVKQEHFVIDTMVDNSVITLSSYI